MTLNLDLSLYAVMVHRLVVLLLSSICPPSPNAFHSLRVKALLTAGEAAPAPVPVPASAPEVPTVDESATAAAVAPTHASGPGPSVVNASVEAAAAPGGVKDDGTELVELPVENS